MKARLQDTLNDCGAVPLLVIVLVAVLAVAAGLAVYNVNRSHKNARTVSTSSVSPSPSSSPATAASPAASPTASWTPFSAKIGKYSLRYNPQWKAKYCGTNDSEDNLQLELSADRLVACNTGGENAHVQIQVYTQSGNALSSADVAEAGFAGSRSDVTVGGVAGHRYEGTKTQHTPLDYPPVETKYIKYVFLANGRTYEFLYHQQPGDTDLSADFDLMVKDTVKFSS